MTAAKTRVLILCTGNSARSQMAEGLLRARGGDRFEVHSAGSRPADRVHPGAVQAMAEIGLDISGQRPKPLSQFLGQKFDYVLTGHMKIVLSTNEVYLGPGDSIYYDSSIPHAMYAIDADCRFIAVVIK